MPEDSKQVSSFEQFHVKQHKVSWKLVSNVSIHLLISNWSQQAASTTGSHGAARNSKSSENVENSDTLTSSQPLIQLTLFFKERRS